MVTEIKGDLLTAPEGVVICHQVNCMGKMNSGVAKAIREKYPEAYKSYMDHYNIHVVRSPMDILGDICIGKSADRIVVNMFSQCEYGYDGRLYTSYDAFWKCLVKIKAEFPQTALAFPARIGCVRGGANWKIIKTMIEEAFTDREVYIYELGI